MVQLATDNPGNQAGSYDTYDSNEKIKTMMPWLKEASAKTGVPLNVLEAVMIKESTGVSINNMKAAGGLMQLSQAKFEELQGKYPGLLGGLSWDSPQGQIMGAAANIMDLKGKGGGTWDGALALYNGGENSGGKLNDPNYLNVIHDYVQKIDAGVPLPS